MTDKRPTPDQLYLASRINGMDMGTDADAREAHRITPAAIQRWNMLHGVELTTNVLRRTWGFMPGDGIANPYAYVNSVMRNTSHG